MARGGEPGAGELAAARAEQAAVASPGEPDLWVAAARLRAALAERQALAAELPATADGPAPRELLAQSGTQAQACAAAARRAWAARAPQAARSLAEGRPAPEALAPVGRAAAEPLYLDALCSAAWARSQGFTQLIERRQELGAALERVLQLQPDLDEAGPDRELGRLLSALPAYAGGSTVRARAHFQAALARAPASVRTRVLFARGVAVKLQDRPLFDRLLREALEAGPAAAPHDQTWLEQARLLQSRAAGLFAGN
jgi:hypothetical protein